MKKQKVILWILGTLLAGLIMLGCNNTVPPGKNEAATESPPGLGKVAYIQSGNLWVKELPDGTAKQLTTDGAALGPRWSKSGKWLLFQKNNQLWLTGSDGTDCRAIGEVAGFTWSTAEDVFYYGSPKNGLVSVHPETSQSKILIKPSAGDNFGRMLNSPDGRYIAFERSSAKQPAAESGGIWKLDITSGNVVNLFKGQAATEKSMGVLPHLAGWSSDGKTIYLWIGSQSASLTADGVAFTAIDAETGKNLSAYNRETGSLVHKNWFVPGPDPDIAFLIIGYGRETWTDKQLALLNLKTKEVKVISAKGQAVASFDISLSGENLAFSAGPDEKEMYNGDTEDYSAKSRKVMMQRHIWAANIDGGPLKQLTNDNDYRDEYPVWSAKDDYILFGRIDKQDKASLWLMKADGSNPRQVVTELSPFDWFGFYGYVDLKQLFDYWRG